MANKFLVLWKLAEAPVCNLAGHDVRPLADMAGLGQAQRPRAE